MPVTVPRPGGSTRRRPDGPTLGSMTALTRSGSVASDAVRAAAQLRSWAARRLPQLPLHPPDVVGASGLVAGVVVADAALFVAGTGSLDRAVAGSLPARAALAMACVRVAGPVATEDSPMSPAGAAGDPTDRERAECRRLVRLAQRLAPDCWWAALLAAAADLDAADPQFGPLAGWLSAAADLPAADLT